MGRSRLWLITTNDNLPALRFYQRLGWDLVALHRGAVNEAGVGAATALNMLRPG